MAHQPDGNTQDNNPQDYDQRNSQPVGSRGRNLEIRVRGHLNAQWSDWFASLELKLMDNGETVLSGHIVDQSALMGILNMLNRLNLTLLSINEIKEE